MRRRAVRDRLDEGRDGDWPVVGVQPDWMRQDWPVLRSCRYDELQDRYLVVSYKDGLFEPASERALAAGDTPEVYLDDALMGDGAVSIRLSQLLDEHSQTPT
jgi:hypothetical protein